MPSLNSEQIDSKTLTLKPFRVQLLSKNKIVVDGFMIEFKATEKYYYSVLLDLTPIWKDEVDLIRITLNIQVQECKL
jgi:hypothetical protein